MLGELPTDSRYFRSGMLYGDSIKEYRDNAISLLAGLDELERHYKKIGLWREMPLDANGQPLRIKQTIKLECQSARAARYPG